LHEILDQDQNVVFPFSQRRHFDGKHIQPIEEILAEGPIRYGGVQVAIRGSNNANVDSNRLPFVPISVRHFWRLRLESGAEKE
jgi:hypothetical protein